VYLVSMKKIEFYTHPVVGKVNKPTSDKYIMLSYFLSDLSDIKTIEDTVSEIKLVQNNQKTFEQVFTDRYCTISIGVTAGTFECDEANVYLISNNPDLEPSLTLPLQEFINILEEWKNFLK